VLLSFLWGGVVVINRAATVVLIGRTTVSSADQGDNCK